jgi:hypothetical protein
MYLRTSICNKNTKPKRERERERESVYFFFLMIRDCTIYIFKEVCYAISIFLCLHKRKFYLFFVPCASM